VERELMRPMRRTFRGTILELCLCLVVGVLFVAWPGGGRKQCGNAPVAAAAAGYCDNTFSTPSFTTSNVDMSNTYAQGFQWYYGNWFGYPASYTQVTLNSGVASVIGTNYNTLGITTAGYNAGAPNGYVGTAFGGGAYFEWKVNFNSTEVNTTDGWPAAWTLSLEHFANLPGQQWTGQVAGYDIFPELDALEYITTGAGGPGLNTVHAHYGTYNVTCSNYCDYNPGAKTYTIATPSTTFTVGMLWVPATSTTDGYTKIYLNNVLQSGTTQTWCQFIYSAQVPPPGSSRCWSLGAADSQHMVGIISSGTNTPINAVAFNVWQLNGANNLHY
jgi:hypothetical protein